MKHAPAEEFQSLERCRRWALVGTHRDLGDVAAQGRVAMCDVGTEFLAEAAAQVGVTIAFLGAVARAVAHLR